jgi:hypothetical protein
LLPLPQITNVRGRCAIENVRIDLAVPVMTEQEEDQIGLVAVTTVVGKSVLGATMDHHLCRIPDLQQQCRVMRTMFPPR